MYMRAILASVFIMTGLGCEPTDDPLGTETGGSPASMTGGSPASTSCQTCRDDAPFFMACTMAETTSDNEQVCIDTDEDELCRTVAECCDQAGVDYDEATNTCSDDGGMNVSMPTGLGMECSEDTDCTDEFPRCDKDASDNGQCAPECLSNDDCADVMGKPFCDGENRCAAASDGTCQIETPDDPRSADGECVGDLARCMPLSEGSSLGICVECYGAVECSAASTNAQCSTRGVCIPADDEDGCEGDADCCPTPDADCAGRRRCNPDSKTCETASP